MNITLSADKELIEKGRKIAKAQGTSLNQLVRDYLLTITGGGETKQAADEFAHLAKTLPGCSDEGFKFSRDEVYDRPGLNPKTTDES